MSEKNLPKPLDPKDEAFARPITRERGSDSVYCFLDKGTGEYKIADKKNEDAYIESADAVDTAEWC